MTGRGSSPATTGWLGAWLAGLLVLMLIGPVLVLVMSTSASEVWAGANTPTFAAALRLSVVTTLVSLGATVLGGTPLAWWLARSSSRSARAVELLVQVPLVVPPAVVGIALLRTFGRQGVLGPVLAALDVDVPFTSRAVVLAQIVVSAPFYVQAARNAFRDVGVDLLIVARTLGASPVAAFLRVALPLAFPGCVAGACLAWARALGEFGATLLFAGNLAGTTQTMPLAIYAALEADVRVAVALSVTLAGASVVLLAALRWVPRGWSTWVRRQRGR